MNHTATVRRIYDLINAGDIDRFVDLMASDFVEHEQLPGLEPTKEGVLTFFRLQRAAFPDMRMEVQDVIASGNRVAIRVRYTETHTGDLMGMPPTGRKVDVQLIDIMGMGDDGLVHEHWGVMDQMTMMQQLGAIPAGPSA